jgi:hypothetical protein
LDLAGMTRGAKGSGPVDGFNLGSSLMTMNTIKAHGIHSVWE